MTEPATKKFTHAVRAYYADGSVVRTPAASAGEALEEARRVVATGNSGRNYPLVQVNVIEWALAEECVWHRDWSDADKSERLYNPEDVI